MKAERIVIIILIVALIGLSVFAFSQPPRTVTTTTTLQATASCPASSVGATYVCNGEGELILIYNDSSWNLQPAPATTNQSSSRSSTTLQFSVAVKSDSLFYGCFQSTGNVTVSLSTGQQTIESVSGTAECFDWTVLHSPSQSTTTYSILISNYDTSSNAVITITEPFVVRNP